MPFETADAGKLPLAPPPSSSLEPSRTGSRGQDVTVEGGAKPPVALDVETQAGVAARGRRALDRRINSALLPCFFMISVANYLDRTNIAFAAAGMRRDIGMTLGEFGIGSSLLFVSYCGLMVPVALIGPRFGLTRTLAAACIVWGIVAASMAAITSVAGFYAARLALGLAEAPTYPLIASVLRTYHASDAAVGAAYSYVHAATLVASVIGGPLAAGVLAMEGLAGLAGWRWLFLIESLPPIAAGIWVLVGLPSSPATAKFLTPDERTRVIDDVAAARPHAAPDAASGRALWSAVVSTLTNWRLVAAGAIEVVNSSGRFAATFFAPLLVEEILTRQKPDAAKPASGHGGGAPKPAKAVILSALLSAIPYGLAALTSVLNGWAAKRARAARGWGRRWFLVWPSWVCAAGLFAVGPLLTLKPTVGSRTGAFVAVVAALQGFALWGPAMSLPSTLAPGSTAHSTVAYGLFTALGMMGGLIGPAVLGATTQKTNSYSVGGAALGSLSLAMGAVWAAAFGCIVPGGK